MFAISSSQTMLTMILAAGTLKECHSQLIRPYLPVVCGMNLCGQWTRSAFWTSDHSADRSTDAYEPRKYWSSIKLRENTVLKTIEKRTTSTIEEECDESLLNGFYTRSFQRTWPWLRSMINAYVANNPSIVVGGAVCCCLFDIEFLNNKQLINAYFVTQEHIPRWSHGCSGKNVGFLYRNGECCFIIIVLQKHTIAERSESQQQWRKSERPRLVKNTKLTY